MGLEHDEVLRNEIAEKDRLEMESEARSVQADADAEREYQGDQS